MARSHCGSDRTRGARRVGISIRRANAARACAEARVASFVGTSARTRWKAARFVPLHVVPRLLAYESLKEDRWAVDPVSEAVLPVEKVRRSDASVPRRDAAHGRRRS